MAMHDAADIRETDSGSFKFIRPMETLKDAEQLGRILHIEPYSIIANKDHHF